MANRDQEIIYVLVAVTGVEGEEAACAAINNLSNDEQDFYPCGSTTTTFGTVSEFGDPAIIFP